MTAYSTASTVGPVVGGYTTFIADQYPESISKSSVLGKFPILLPNIMIVSGLILGTMLAAFLLPKDTAQEDAEISLLREQDETDSNEQSRTSFIRRFKSSNLAKVLTIKECWLCCLLYGTFGIVDFGFNEMFPVLASTSPHLKGLGMNPSK